MAAEDPLLFKIDTIVVDGKPIAFEDGSCTISGVARFENRVMPSASGPDFALRTRVPTTLRARIQFNRVVDPAELAGQKGVQITARDTQSGRRVLCQNCMFGALGDVGGGSVDITYNLMTPLQWL